MVPVTFTIEGIRAGRAATVTWTEREGYDDPDAVVAERITSGEQVCGTVTGPCYAPADRPIAVAWLTAIQAFDTITKITDPHGVQFLIEELCAVPSEATA